MRIKTFQTGVLGANCHIVINDGEALIIDLGGDYATVRDYLKKEKVTPLAVLLTHGHFDHIEGVIDAQKELPVYVFEREKKFLNDVSLNLANEIGGFQKGEITEVVTFTEGNLKIGSFDVKVIHTPGHTSGSCCFLIENALFSGDTLFKNGFGRYDLPTGDFKSLTRSVYRLIHDLDESVTVYTGHGESTTIKEERINNSLYNYVKDKF